MYCPRHKCEMSVWKCHMPLIVSLIGGITVSNGTVTVEQIKVYLSSLLALFQMLIAAFLHALDVFASDEMEALIQRAAFRQGDEGGLISVSLWCCEPTAALIVHWLTGQQLKNDTLIFRLIHADCIIPVMVLVNMRWLAFKRKQSVKLKQTSPHLQRQPSNSQKEKAMEI